MATYSNKTAASRKTALFPAPVDEVVLFSGDGDFRSQSEKLAKFRGI
jgi:uncharacterized LabA/DUF88 family protein